MIWYLRVRTNLCPLTVSLYWTIRSVDILPEKKVDPVYTGKHLRQMLEQNQYTKVSVKIFTDYTAFLARTESMQHMAETNRPDTKKKGRRNSTSVISDFIIEEYYAGNYCSGK